MNSPSTAVLSHSLPTDALSTLKRFVCMSMFRQCSIKHAEWGMQFPVHNVGVGILKALLIKRHVIVIVHMYTVMYHMYTVMYHSMHAYIMSHGSIRLCSMDYAMKQDRIK